MWKNYQASSEKAMPIFIHRDKKKIKNFLKIKRLDGMGRIRESISKLLTILLILILSLTPLSTVQAGYNGGQGGNGSHHHP